MKKLMMVAVVLVAGSSIAQTTPETPTDSSKLEAFLSKKDSMIVREQVFYGQISVRNEAYFRIEGIKVYEPNKETFALKGAAMTVWSSNNPNDMAAEFVDFEELESLNDAITYMITLAPIWASKTTQHIKIRFLTKSGFIFGMYKEYDNMLAFAESSPKVAFMDIPYLPQIKTLVSNLIKSF